MTKTMRRLMHGDLRTVFVFGGFFLIGILSLNSFWSTADPLVMGDELVFASAVLNNNGSAFAYSAHFFQFVYQVTFLFEDWYLAARFIGVIASAAGGAIVFRVVSKEFPTWIAAVTGSAYFVFSMSVFSMTYLPEVLYYLLSIVALALLGRSLYSQSWAVLALSALSLSLAMLTKPHATVLLIGAVVYMLLSLTQLEKGKMGKRLAQTMAFLGLTLAFRTLIAIALGDRQPFSLFGSYSQVVEAPDQNPTPGNGVFPEGQLSLVSYLWKFLPDYLPMIFLILILSLPLVATWRFKRSKEGVKESQLSIFVTVAAVSAIGYAIASWLFAGLVSIQGDDHSDRILLRYSEFLLPILTLGPIVASRATRSPATSRALAFLSLAASAYILFYFLSGAAGAVNYKPSDSSIFLALANNPLFLGLFVILLLVAPAQYFVGKNGGLYAGIAFATLIIFANSNLHFDLGRYFSFESDFRENAIQVNEIVGDKCVVFASRTRVEPTSVMFTSSRLNDPLELVPGYSQVDYDRCDFIAAFGQIFPQSASDIRLSNDQLVLYEKSNIYTSQVEIGSGVLNVEMLGPQTSWGFWLSNESTEITFEETVEESEVVLGLVRHEFTDVLQVQVAFEVGGKLQDPINFEIPEGGPIYEVSFRAPKGTSSLKITYSGQVDIDLLPAGNFRNYGLGISKFKVS